MSLLPGLLVGLALILANAFFVAAEFAFVAVDRTRLELRAEEGSRAARTALRLLTKLSFNLSGAQLGITITSLALGLLAQPVVAKAIEPLVAGVVGEASALAVSVVIALLLTTVVQMVIGELIPKSVAVARPLVMTLQVAAPYRLYAMVFKPVIAVCNSSANALLRLVGVEPTEELLEVRSREELRRLVRTSREGGTIRSQTAELLDRSFRFGNKTAADALTPRVDVQALPLDSEVGDLMDLSGETGISRFPVHGGDLDTLLGVVHIKEVLGLPRERRRTAPLSVLMRPVAMVPETKPLDELLDELQDAAAHLAVVLDEYGGTAGIITVEDLVEEIVGDIADEHDVESSIPAAQAWRGAHLLSGRLHPDEVRDACEFEVPEGEYETLAGFVLDRLGRIPDIGEGFAHDGWQLSVAEMDGHRVATVRVVSPPPGAVSDEAALR
ncbi:MAG: HlyC/CorC family transporter [Actinomycetia bacterium]|nr:HlyC/CorC family transporter [Actinomycetes bacterium]